MISSNDTWKVPRVVLVEVDLGDDGHRKAKPSGLAAEVVHGELLVGGVESEPQQQVSKLQLMTEEEVHAREVFKYGDIGRTPSLLSSVFVKGTQSGGEGGATKLRKCFKAWSLVGRGHGGFSSSSSSLRIPGCVVGVMLTANSVRAMRVRIHSI
ncbi:hypothetical protein BHM03_00034707 [Ensete ventricosum]|uniref:Uncharacterized protein n=1 Tax=Ensete ventricosum TaxID=4639 RepID=A0A445MJ47_ENSVE|nr:hypothetical protein BHM03_00034707 [Ensete ventricosum]